mgnify:CR=1 FL=1
MKKIILTGGGTAGHITPNIALLPALKELGYDIKYIGSKTGMETELIKAQGIAYEGISSGKLSRYFDFKNFTDPFRVVKGLFEARRILKKFSPDIVFSKGGFVSVPVVMAAAFLKIPVIIHESDITPGLANKIASKFATKICTNFPETLKYLPKNKAILTGSPIRQELLNGDKEAARKITGFDDKPTLLIIGGSLGSVIVNTAIRKSLDDILKEFKGVKGVIHCYSYSKEMAREFIKLGYMIGVGGVSTFKNAKQFTAYLGLDPRKYQSGTSVNGKSRISKIGNSEIRKSLYMPAVVAYRCNAFPEFVGRLKKKGKHIKLILIAIMRKLAVIAFTLMKNGQEFQAERYK